MRNKLILYSLTVFLVFCLSVKLTSGEDAAKRNKWAHLVKDTGQKAVDNLSKVSNPITIFMCGDVMTGRGIDQVLPHPSDPLIHEPYMKSARGYVEIAEKANGQIQKPVSFSYIWGDAIKELERVAPDVRIINLETSVTKSNDY